MEISCIIPFVSRKAGFTLLELLVVIAIIGILSSVALSAANTARERARFSRVKTELRQIALALELYADDNDGNYPADVARNTMPVGLSAYMSSRGWPVPPWQGAYYDWDSWNIAGVLVQQISVRFCPLPTSPPSACTFPSQPWVIGAWDGYSSVYYCVQGPCRAHESQSVMHPAYCAGGKCF